MHWLLLGGAIVSEVFATSMLKFSEGFTKLWPSVAVVVGYAISFYLLALVLKTMSIGVAYATWSAVGIVAITMIGVFVFSQSLSPLQIVGIVVTVLGVVLLNLGGGDAAHAASASGLGELPASGRAQ